MSEGKVMIIGGDEPSGYVRRGRLSPGAMTAIALFAAAGSGGPVIGRTRPAPALLDLFGPSPRMPRAAHQRHHGSKEAARRLRQMERQKRG